MAKSAAAPAISAQDVMALLTEATVGTPIEDSDVQFHPGDETHYIVPKGTSFERAIQVFELKKEEQNQVFSVDKLYDYRPMDGANATANVLKDMFGITTGKAVATRFGIQPPQFIDIAVGFGKTRQVPWGRVQIPGLGEVFVDLGAIQDRERGPLFYMSASVPKKHKGKIEEFYARVLKELKENSIYRGKALVGAHELEYLDVSSFDANKICFSDEVTAALEVGLFGPVKFTDALKREGIEPKRAVLLYGPYGTGKSSVGMITAQLAERNGWTFLQARTGKDELKDVLRTAKLYQKAIVFAEDIDAASATTDPKKISELLEIFDGITAKGSEIILVMTTNNVEQLHAGLMRPGRLDYMIEVAALDLPGITRLIKAVVPAGKLSEDVDYDKLYEHMLCDGEPFLPAFVRATIHRSITLAVTRTGGAPDYLITTQDLSAAALSLHAQLRMLRKATEDLPAPELKSAMENAIREAINGVSVQDFDGDEMYKLSTKDLITAGR